MTANKHLKQLVRARMARTGERYAAARRQIIREHSPDRSNPQAPAHLPGSIPAATALRILLRHSGARPSLSEAMAFGIAGGIGIGVFAFYYEREDVANFFIAGRHRWHDDQAYLFGALERLGVRAIIRESGGAKAARRQLIELVAAHGPCIAWVDMAGLPHRAMPEFWQGGGYHVVLVYAVDAVAGTALIGDLTDEPITIGLDELAQAQARIKKQQHRLLALEAAPDLSRLDDLILAGLRSCHAELLQPTLTQAAGNARLEALSTWAERMHGGTAKNAWERTFRPGPNLWRGLTAIYDFVEHYGTGGGLCRPIFADFLAESAAFLGRADLEALAEQYRVLGRAWSDLADAALPDDVAPLAEAKRLLAHKAELLHTGAPAAEVRAVWEQLADLERETANPFPLDNAGSTALRAGLRSRIEALYTAEQQALQALSNAVQ
ncbi:MAG: BtrH N-terminal domain-containing protein [Oscillochloris sp.]|nr:BtrH N-terminal domain-containing protein [Oscillochloris sp.]